jgi:hypothetical protein
MLDRRAIPQAAEIELVKGSRDVVKPGAATFVGVVEDRQQKHRLVRDGHDDLGDEVQEELAD